MATKKKKKSATGKAEEANKAALASDKSRGEELLAWTVSPLQRDKRKARLFVGSTLAFLLLVYIAYRELMWVFFAALLMVGAFSSYIFPSRYRLTTVGVEQKALVSGSFKPWSSFVMFTKYPDGVQLRYSRGKWQNRFNPGIFLYFGEDNSSEVLKLVNEHITQPDKSER